MTRRRLRATFLLKGVCILLSLAIPAIVFRVFSSGAVTLWALGFVILFWLVGIEAELLPLTLR